MLNSTDLLVYWFIRRRICAAKCQRSKWRGHGFAMAFDGCFGVGWPVCIDTNGTIMSADSTTEILIKAMLQRTCNDSVCPCVRSNLCTRVTAIPR